MKFYFFRTVSGDMQFFIAANNREAMKFASYYNNAVAERGSVVGTELVKMEDKDGNIIIDNSRWERNDRAIAKAIKKNRKPRVKA